MGREREREGVKMCGHYNPPLDERLSKGGGGSLF